MQFCKKKPSLGDTVIFTNKYGEPTTESVGLVTAINEDETVDLVCFFRNETFHRLSVHRGNHGERETWHPKP